MSLITDLKLADNKKSVTWFHDGREVNLTFSDAGQVIVDEVNQKIVVAICEGKYPKQLKVYSFHGDEECTLNEPKEFQFYYLQKNSSYGVSVICTTAEPIDGRLDWQFYIEYSSCTLTRFAPAY